MFKTWIAWLFKIPQAFIVMYEKDGRKVLTISYAVRGKKTETKRYLVEHLLNENLEVTEQTLKQEKKMFVDV